METPDKMERVGSHRWWHGLLRHPLNLVAPVRGALPGTN